MWVLERLPKRVMFLCLWVLERLPKRVMFLCLFRFLDAVLSWFYHGFMYSLIQQNMTRLTAWQCPPEAALGVTMGDSSEKRTIHAVLGTSVMLVLLLHLFYGLNLGFSI